MSLRLRFFFLRFVKNVSLLLALLFLGLFFYRYSDQLKALPYFSFDVVKDCLALTTVRGGIFFLALWTLFSCIHISRIICPNCLKVIFVNKLAFTCPFCDADHKAGSPLFVKSLLGKCSECKGEIRYVQCYHCSEQIDLFEPYSERELKRRRYEE